MRNELYYGLRRIAERLGVGKSIARSMIEHKFIRAYKSGKSSTSPWYCVESEINEDIENLPKKM